MTIARGHMSHASRLSLVCAMLALVVSVAWATPAVASWQDSAIPPARYDHSLAAINGRAFMFGGVGEQGTLGDLWLYDGAWQVVTAAAGPSPRARHAAAAANGRMYVLFGQDATGALLDDVWVYDPLPRTWQQRRPLGAAPAAREGHTAVAIGNDLFVFGGHVVGGIADSCVWRYHTLSNDWEKGACLDPTQWPNGARVGHAAFVADGAMYVYPPDVSLASLLRYDPASNAWSVVPVLDDFYAPRSWTAVAWRDNRAWLMGGEIPTLGQTPNILEYALPPEGSPIALRPLPCLPNARRNARAVALTGGSGASSTLTQVLVFGGLRGGQPLAESVVYTIGPASPPTATPTRVPPTETPTPTVTPSPTATASATRAATPTAGQPPAWAWRVHLPLVVSGY